MELGHRHLGVLSLRPSAEALSGPADARTQAAATASVARGRLEERDVPPSRAGVDWSAVAVEQCQISDVSSGRSGAHAPLDRAPDMMPSSRSADPLALGARLSARQRGLSVPDGLSIVCFDASAPESDGLTTVHQPLREKGRAGTELLLRMLAGDERRRTVLPTSLWSAASTARLRS